MVEIEVTIKMANERRQTERLLIESCIFFYTDKLRVELFGNKQFNIFPLSVVDVNTTNVLKLSDDEFNEIIIKKCTLQVLGNRKLIFREEISLI